tara:strand:- start:1297 stop:1515 length:219 start_codon:yes stop_codon:yes gene_type:complete
MRRSDLDLSRQSGNRFTGASGYSAREAEAVFNIMVKLDKLKLDDRRYVLIRNRLQTAIDILQDTLEIAGRVK